MAERRDIGIDQGATVAISVFVTQDDGSPLNLADYVKRSQMRRHFTSRTFYEFTCDTGDDEAGEIVLSLTPEESAAIPAGRYQYDVEIEDNTGNVFRVIEGCVSVFPEVTK